MLRSFPVTVVGYVLFYAVDSLRLFCRFTGFGYPFLFVDPLFHTVVYPFGLLRVWLRLRTLITFTHTFTVVYVYPFTFGYAFTLLRFVWLRLIARTRCRALHTCYPLRGLRLFVWLWLAVWFIRFDFTVTHTRTHTHATFYGWTRLFPVHPHVYALRLDFGWLPVYVHSCYHAFVPVAFTQLHITLQLRADSLATTVYGYCVYGTPVTLRCLVWLVTFTVVPLRLHTFIPGWLDFDFTVAGLRCFAVTRWTAFAVGYATFAHLRFGLFPSCARVWLVPVGYPPRVGRASLYPHAFMDARFPPVPAPRVCVTLRLVRALDALPRYTVTVTTRLRLRTHTLRCGLVVLRLPPTGFGYVWLGYVWLFAPFRLFLVYLRTRLPRLVGWLRCLLRSRFALRLHVLPVTFTAFGCCRFTRLPTPLLLQLIGCCCLLRWNIVVTFGYALRSLLLVIVLHRY